VRLTANTKRTMRDLLSQRTCAGRPGEVYASELP
jgi:hypothetical protein